MSLKQWTTLTLPTTWTKPSRLVDKDFKKFHRDCIDEFSLFIYI